MRNRSLVWINNVLYNYILHSVVCFLQVLFPIIFSEMRYSKKFDKRKSLNGVFFFQYVPRVLRIYISWMNLTRTASKLTRIVWVKAAFNFFLYIFSSHVSFIIDIIFILRQHKFLLLISFFLQEVSDFCQGFPWISLENFRFEMNHKHALRTCILRTYVSMLLHTFSPLLSLNLKCEILTWSRMHGSIYVGTKPYVETPL